MVAQPAGELGDRSVWVRIGEPAKSLCEVRRKAVKCGGRHPHGLERLLPG